MEINSIISIVGLALSGLLALAGVFRFIATTTDTLRREIDTAKENARLFAEKVAEAESRQRHAANNATQAIIARMDQDLRALSKETVRQDQMSALEQRIETALSKIEAKLEKFGEAAAEMATVRQQLATVNSRLERISDRLDEQGGVMKNTRVG